jgi:hypothetical protein
MEAMEGFEDLGDIGNQSVRAIAKLADSDKVRFPSFWQCVAVLTPAPNPGS